MIYNQIRLYEDREDVTLTSYILDDSVEMLDGGKRGAILICPGGAFLYCSDREGEPVAMAFAAMGYQTFVLRYSVYNKNKGENILENVMPNMNQLWITNKYAEYPGAIHDVGAAILYIKEHAEEYHIDMEKLALCGFSAGAHICGLYATNYHRPIIKDYFGHGIENVKPAAVILGYMLSDFRIFLDKNLEEYPLYAACIHAYCGTPILKDPELAKAMSPCCLVNEHTPPMFLWCTSEDQTVDPAHSIKMAMALQEYHIPYELHIFENGPHGMVLGNYATAGMDQHVDTNIERWIHMCDRWLQKRMKPVFPTQYRGL